MKFLRKSSLASPKVSLILLDWSVRESFHIIDYLDKQNVPRDNFEIIVIEYYSKISSVIKKYEEQIDTWVLLEAPNDIYYHKHYMINAGIIVASAEIVVICDSDAMVTPGFVATIIDHFGNHDKTILHMDQFRNSRKDLYPFCYPSFEEVVGEGCINNIDGKPAGLADDIDTIHRRNYGACMCAKKTDLIAIGGADEHVDFLGHVCGPYDFSFRLANIGFDEVWHQSEFLYHTWHPGQAGDDNYMGPHDGKHVSSRSIDSLLSGTTMPAIENSAIKKLRKEKPFGTADAISILENEKLPNELYRITGSDRAFHDDDPRFECGNVGRYAGYRIFKEGGKYSAWPLVFDNDKSTRFKIFSGSLQEVKNIINKTCPLSINIIYNVIYRLLFATVMVDRIVKGALTFYRNRKRNNIPVTTKAGITNAGAPLHAKSMYRKISDIFSAASSESMALAKPLRSLLINVHYNELADLDSTFCLLLVEGKRFYLPLKILKTIGKITNIKLEEIMTAEQFSQAVTGSFASVGLLLLVCENVALAHHTTFTRLSRDKKIIVI